MSYPKFLIYNEIQKNVIEKYSKARGLSVFQTKEVFADEIATWVKDRYEEFSKDNPLTDQYRAVKKIEFKEWIHHIPSMNRCHRSSNLCMMNLAMTASRLKAILQLTAHFAIKCIYFNLKAVTLYEC